MGPDGGNHDVGERALPELLDLIPVNQKRPYDMRAMLAARRRRGTVTEIQPTYGTSIITALVRIGGHAVAVVANQPTVTAGAVTVAAADKAAAFLQLAGAFHLPVLFLADNPGVMAGSASEKAGILKASARMFAAQHRLRTPKFHVTVRKAFGFGSSVMGANPYDNQTMTLAFPAVTLGGIPADVGGRTAKEDDDTRRALVENEASGPWALAQTLFYDDVIDPRELRNILLRGLDGAVRAARPNRWHTTATCADLESCADRESKGTRHVDELGRRVRLFERRAQRRPAVLLRQVGLEADGSVPADPERQYDLAFATLAKLLAEHGARPSDLVELTSFHVDFPQHMTEFMAAKARFQNGARPAWTAVGVTALGMPGVLVEVKATARIGGA